MPDYSFDLDLRKARTQDVPFFSARQGDKDTDKVTIKILDEGKPANTADLIVKSVFFEAVSGGGVVVRKQVPTANISFVVNNPQIIRYPIPAETYTGTGTISECYFRIEDSTRTTILSTSRFVIHVRPSATGRMPSVYIDEIQKLINQFNEILENNNLDDLNGRLEAMEALINQFNADMNARIELLKAELSIAGDKWTTDLQLKIAEINNTLNAVDTTLRAAMESMQTDLTNQMNTLRADLLAEMASTETIINNKLNTLATDIDEQMTTIIADVNAKEAMITAKIDALNVRIDNLNLEQVIIEVIKSGETAEYVQNLVVAEVTNQFETAGAVSIPIAQQMLGGKDGTTPAPELANTLSNVLFNNQAVIVNRTLDFSNKIADSLVENPHILQYGSTTAQTIISPTVGPWGALNQNQYNWVNKLDGTVLTMNRAGSASVPTPVAQALLTINATAEFERLLPNFYLAGMTDTQKAQVTKSIIEQFSATVYAKSTAASGSLKTTLTLYNGTSGAYGVNTTVTNADIKPLTIASNNASTQAYVHTNTGMVYFNIMADAGTETVPSVLAIDYITFTLRAKPRVQDVFAMRNNTVSLDTTQTITGAKTFSAITKHKATSQNNIFNEYQNASGQRMAYVGFPTTTATDYTVGIDATGQPNGGVNLTTAGTGTAKVNGQLIVDRGALAISDELRNTDLNTITKNGTYRVFQATNAPLGLSNWFYLEHQTYIASYVIQKAIQLDTNGRKIMFIRRLVNNVWEEWWSLSDYLYHPLVTPFSVDLRKPQQNAARGISWSNQTTGAFEGGMGYQYGWVNNAEEPRSIYMGLGPNPWVDSAQGMRVNFVSSRLEAFNKGFITKNLTTDVLLEPLLFGTVARIRGANNSNAIVMEANQEIYLRAGVTTSGVEGQSSVKIGPTAGDFTYNAKPIALVENIASAITAIPEADATLNRKGLMTGAQATNLDLVRSTLSPLGVITLLLTNDSTHKTDIKVYAEKFSPFGSMTHIRLIGSITGLGPSPTPFTAGNQLFSLASIITSITSGTFYGYGMNTAASAGALDNTGGPMSISFARTTRIVSVENGHTIGVGKRVMFDTVLALTT